VLVATAGAVRWLLPRRKSTPAAERRIETVDLRWPLQAVWMRPYLRRVAGIVLLSAVTLTLVDFLFKSAVVAAVPPDQLGSFFATTYLALNALSLAAQLFVVSWVIRRLSVNRVLSVLPALVVAATTGLVLGGGVLRHSLHRTALEVLYVPLTGDLRARQGTDRCAGPTRRTSGGLGVNSDRDRAQRQPHALWRGGDWAGDRLDPRRGHPGSPLP
jgi:hypothetical protein